MRLAFATGNYGEFSLNGGLPWGKPIKEDMEHFKAFCAGKVLIMGYKTWLSMPDSTKEKYKMLVLFTRKDENYFNFEGLKFFIDNKSQLISFLEFLKECEEGLDTQTEYCLIGGTMNVETALINLEVFDSVLYTRVSKNDDSMFPNSTSINEPLLGNPDVHYKMQEPFFYEKGDMTVNVTIYNQEKQLTKGA